MSSGPPPSIVVVTGPTASGKSALALALAEQLGGEIVNADSVQIYSGFDIGSAKPDAAEQQRVPHHLFSIARGDESFDAGAFVVRAEQTIAGICARDALPVVAGGTGLYLTALLNGLAAGEGEAEAGEARKSRLAALERERGVDELYGEERARALHGLLTELDPAIAARLHPHDMQRVRRALEVVIDSGERLSERQERHRFGDRPYQALVFVVLPDRERLYRAIDRRVDEMIAEGFVDEVRVLRDRFDDSVKPLGSLGYKQLRRYLNDEITLAAAVEEMKRETRRFAKRQYTWWRHQPARLGWTDVRLLEGNTLHEEGRAIGNVELALRYTRAFLSKSQPFTAGGIYYLNLDRFGFE